MVARRALLGILPRETLERLSQSERPHLYTKSELVALAADKWDLDEVQEAVQRIFRRADPEGTQP
jgi:hypothetical protein